MLSAILSDTLLLKSPTCTDEDVAAVHELSAIAGVDPQSYGLDMLRSGADLRDRTTDQLISADAKQFSMSGAKVQIAQLNAVDVEDVLSRQSEVEAAMRKAIESNGFDLFLLVVTRCCR